MRFIVIGRGREHRRSRIEMGMRRRLIFGFGRLSGMIGHRRRGVIWEDGRRTDSGEVMRDHLPCAELLRRGRRWLLFVRNEIGHLRLEKWRGRRLSSGILYDLHLHENNHEGVAETRRSILTFESLAEDVACGRRRLISTFEIGAHHRLASDRRAEGSWSKKTMKSGWCDGAALPHPRLLRHLASSSASRSSSGARSALQVPNHSHHLASQAQSLSHHLQSQSTVHPSSKKS